jgi:hypothetical protein
MEIAAIRRALVNVLRTVPEIKAVYEYPTLEIAREWPAVALRPLEVRVDRVARGLSTAEWRWEVWLGIPVDQKTSEAAWRSAQDVVDAVIERLATWTELSEGSAVAAVTNAGFAFVSRDVGPVVEARVVVTVRVPILV